MNKSFMTSTIPRLALMLLLGAPNLLAGCCKPLKPPPPAPAVIPCQKPAVSQELLQPPQTAAIDALLKSLGMLPLSAEKP